MNKVFFNWITICTQTFEDMPRILPKSIYKQLHIFLSTLFTLQFKWFYLVQFLHSF